MVLLKLNIKPYRSSAPPKAGIRIGYDDSQQKVWNCKAWSVGWYFGGNERAEDPAVAMFSDGSKMQCADILVGELATKGIVKRKLPPPPEQKVKASKNTDACSVVPLGTHPNSAICNMSACFGRDAEGRQFARLMNGNKKQLCQVTRMCFPYGRLMIS